MFSPGTTDRLAMLSLPRKPPKAIDDEERIAGIGTKVFRALPYRGAVPTTKFDTSDGTYGVGPAYSFAAPYAAGLDDVGGIRAGESWELSLARSNDLRLPSDVSMDEIRKFFLKEDGDLDGRISQDDVLRIVKQHNLPLTKNDVRRMFEDVYAHRDMMSQRNPVPSIDDIELSANFKTRRKFDPVVTMTIDIQRRRTSYSSQPRLSGGIHISLAELEAVVDEVCLKYPLCTRLWEEIQLELPIFDDTKAGKNAANATIDDGSSVSSGHSFFESIINGSAADVTSPEYIKWRRCGSTSAERRLRTRAARVAFFLDTVTLSAQLGATWADVSLSELQTALQVDSSPEQQILATKKKLIQQGVAAADIEEDEIPYQVEVPVAAGGHELPRALKLDALRPHIECLMLPRQMALDVLSTTRSMLRVMETAVDRELIEEATRSENMRKHLQKSSAKRHQAIQSRKQIIDDFIAKGGDSDSENDEISSRMADSNRQAFSGTPAGGSVEGGNSEGASVSIGNSYGIPEGDLAVSEDGVGGRDIRSPDVEMSRNASSTNFHTQRTFDPSGSTFIGQESIMPIRVIEGSENLMSNIEKRAAIAMDPQMLLGATLSEKLSQVDARWVREGDSCRISVLRPRYGWVFGSRTHRDKWDMVLQACGFEALNKPNKPSNPPIFAHPDLDGPHLKKRTLPLEYKSIPPSIQFDALAPRTQKKVLKSLAASEKGRELVDYLTQNMPHADRNSLRTTGALLNAHQTNGFSAAASHTNGFSVAADDYSADAEDSEDRAQEAEDDLLAWFTQEHLPAVEAQQAAEHAATLKASSKTSVKEAILAASGVRMTGDAKADALAIGQVRRNQHWMDKVRAERTARQERTDVNPRRLGGFTGYATNSVSLVADWPLGRSVAAANEPANRLKEDDVPLDPSRAVRQQRRLGGFEPTVKGVDTIDLHKEAAAQRGEMRGKYYLVGDTQKQLDEALVKEVGRDPRTNRYEFDTIADKVKVNPKLDTVSRIADRRRSGSATLQRSGHQAATSGPSSASAGRVVLRGETEYDQFIEYEQQRINGHKGAGSTVLDENLGRMVKVDRPVFQSHLPAAQQPDKTQRMVEGDQFRDAIHLTADMKFGHPFREDLATEEPRKGMRLQTRPLGASQIEKTLPLAPLSFL